MEGQGEDLDAAEDLLRSDSPRPWLSPAPDLGTFGSQSLPLQDQKPGSQKRSPGKNERFSARGGVLRFMLVQNRV